MFFFGSSENFEICFWDFLTFKNTEKIEDKPRSSLEWNFQRSLQKQFLFWLEGTFLIIDLAFKKYFRLFLVQIETFNLLPRFTDLALLPVHMYQSYTKWYNKQICLYIKECAKVHLLAHLPHMLAIRVLSPMDATFLN